MKRRLVALAAAAALATGAAHAGRTCETQAPAPQNIVQALELAANTARALDASGAQAVVLARRGQDLGRWNLRYSHVGLAYKEGAQWRVVHKLNQCGTAHADVYRQGLGEFFLDDLWRYEAAFAPLAPEVAAKLVPALRDDTRAAALHTPAYSMVAYPWAQRYQQSNQWAIETLASTQVPAANNRERAQAWLQLQGYEPTVLKIGAFTRLGARVGTAHIAFDDHPNEKRFADRIETVGADSVFDWLARSGLGGAAQVIR